MRSFAWILPLLSMAVACSPPQVANTRLGSGDLVQMTDRMAASLLASTAIGERAAASPAWVITLDRVVNQTNHIMPAGERWAFAARVRAKLAESPALAGRNLYFVLPAERAAKLKLRQPELPGQRRTATHALTATFYSVTTATRQARTDSYLCSFQLLDLASDRIVWEDRFEVKRGVVRNRMD
ncbi:MAG: penicillin-binding protein activator LpoB [Phycisphaerae bacterium]|nr:penicillin-binding protein activator LpoB [Phycisphaerae bacterium]